MPGRRVVVSERFTKLQRGTALIQIDAGAGQGALAKALDKPVTRAEYQALVREWREIRTRQGYRLPIGTSANSRPRLRERDEDGKIGALDPDGMATVPGRKRKLTLHEGRIRKERRQYRLKDAEGRNIVVTASTEGEAERKAQRMIDYGSLDWDSDKWILWRAGKLYLLEFVAEIPDE